MEDGEEDDDVSEAFSQDAPEDDEATLDEEEVLLLNVWMEFAVCGCLRSLLCAA